MTLIGLFSTQNWQIVHEMHKKQFMNAEQVSQPFQSTTMPLCGITFMSFTPIYAP